MAQVGFLQSMRHNIGAGPEVNETPIKKGDHLLQAKTSETQVKTSERQRTNSFFSSAQQEGGNIGKQLMRIDPHEQSNIGSIKDIALFSRISKFEPYTAQKLKDEHPGLHPKIRDLGLNLINEAYQSSNQRCIAMLLALKHFVHVSISINQ